ncbi:MAG: thiamine pyrophosphate-dependent enzyme [Candidatus Bipolaricaulota bacterium]
MPRQLMSGDEALAQGAIDAGLSGAYAYPGTPSTEITEYILHSAGTRDGLPIARWTANEKTALEAALGMSYAGRRAMASMKHVGLNVAADPFLNMAISGVQGGLLVNVADDPSMHSSQNEQDSRHYADFALVPCAEPSDAQEAYEIPRQAFALSERLRLPVLVRLTTRLAHGRSLVQLGTPLPPTDLGPSSDRERFVLLPSNARKSYARLVALQAELEAESEQHPLNRLDDRGDPSLGIIACGVAHSYLLEAADGETLHPTLKIGFYPPPRLAIARLAARCRTLLLLEEGYPFLESRVGGLLPRKDLEIRGRLTGHLPRTGELSADLVAAALGRRETASRPPSSVPRPRPPALCPGCPHADTCRALSAALSDYPAARVFSDIGCYTLGALPPFSALDTCIVMGASITMARGASDAGVHPAVAVLGDSTFAHSGMTGLLDCINDRANVTILLLDNETVAMTGGQPSAAMGRLSAICRGLGVLAENLHTIVPHPSQHERNVELLRCILRTPGPSVVIAERECLQTAKRRPGAGEAA